MEVIVACLLLVLFCTSCSLIGKVSIVPLPDPFALPPREKAVSRAEGIKLEAIVDVNGKWQAALACGQEHVVLTRGGTIKGFKVVAIEHDRVVLAKGRVERVLHVN